jgi:hypothetical protein
VKLGGDQQMNFRFPWILVISWGTTWSLRGKEQANTLKAPTFIKPLFICWMTWSQDGGLLTASRVCVINMLRAGVDEFNLQKLMVLADLQVLQRYLAQTA